MYSKPHEWPTILILLDSMFMQKEFLYLLKMWKSRNIDIPKEQSPFLYFKAYTLFLYAQMFPVLDFTGVRKIWHGGNISKSFIQTLGAIKTTERLKQLGQR